MDSDASLIAPRKTGRSAELTLHELILDECVDDQALVYLLPEGKPHAWENSLWDYKRELPSTSGRAPDAASTGKICELIKDVVSFHNAYGGYIVSGVDQYAADPIVGCDNLNVDGFTAEKLNDYIYQYTRTKINCRFRKVAISGVDVGLLLIPMRPDGVGVVQFVKGAPEVKAGKSGAFKKGDIYARVEDASKPVHGDIQGLQFLCSRRELHPKSEIQLLENNLPLRDPNVIKFVGRAEYLLRLWSWLTDRHAPVKVLTALGGTGKTAIAYEFCHQLISSPPSWAHKVVWLTAKKQAFSAIQGKWVSVTRTDFSTVDEFLKSLASELGATSVEIDSAEDRAGLLDVILEGISAFPSIIVVDDVDSLSLDHQADLFSVIQNIAGRAFSSGCRILVTSRLELGAGDDQRIPVRGFELDEFKEFAGITAAERHIRLPDGATLRLHKASLGSPTFCSSILRLVSLGADINAAIHQWKGKEGEEVRRFAFERELEQLSDSEARTLYTLSVLGETTQLELGQILNADESHVSRDLAKLREYHLFAASGDPSTGVKLSVPEPVRLMNDILRKRVTDPTRIEKECARARANVPKLRDKVSSAIASILALWQADDYDAALFSAEEAAKSANKNADIHCVLGQCYLKVSPAKADAADRAFTKATLLGCSRPELVPHRLEAKAMARDWQGIVDMYATLPPPEFRSRSVLFVLMAFWEIGTQQVARGDQTRAIETMRTGMDNAGRAIVEQRAGDQVTEVREYCRDFARQYVKSVSLQTQRHADGVDVFNAVMDAFKCHIAEAWMIDSGLNGLRSWALAVLERPKHDRGVHLIIESKLVDLAQLARQLERESANRRVLAREVRAVEAQMVQLKDFISKKGV